jgi:VCBS repeat-containing protein
VIKGQPPTLGNGPKGELPELEMTPPLGGPMPVLPVLPPPMLATFPGEALDALETLAAEADAAARAEFDQGFLAAIKDLSGLFADTIEGQEGSDIGFGNAGSDVMRGGEGRELFYGGTGFDTAEGGEGDDIFYGGDGNDWFVGGPGDDWYRGGLGSGDTAQFPLPLEAYEVETDEDGLLIKRFGDAEDDDAEADEDGPAVEIDILDNDGIAETDFVWSDVETFVFSGDGASSAEVNAQVGVAPSLSAPGFVSFDFSQTEGLVSVLNGVVSYDPNGQFEDLDAGETAEDSFQYTLNDGRGGGDTATVTITITGADEEEEPEPEPEAEPGPPRLVARNDLAFTDEDSAVTINVLGNDRGGDEPIVVTGVGDSQMGAELSVNPDGTIDYTPPPVANGLAAGDTDKDFFTYTVADSAGQTATATVLVELEGRNDAPRATNVGTNTPLGQSVIVGGFFADPDQGDTVSVGAVPPISELGATLRFVGDALFYDPGTLDTVPEPGGTLIDRFDYLVRDQSGASDFGTATVQVINRQDGEAPAPMTMGDEGDNAFALSAVAMPGTLDAGGGEDTVRLPGALSEYGFEPIEGGHRAVRGEAGEGTDLLGVERILLDDARIVAEDDPALATISFFYRLTYGRDADIAGLSHWYGAHEDGMGLGAIADAFAEAPEFTEVFGPDVESEDFIAALYDRGLQRMPDDEGSAHWSAALDSGEADWGDMLEAFAASEEMAELYANDVDDGILVLV